MGILDFIIFLGGIGLFLYGIRIMGQGLEMSAGEKLKYMLDKVTSNKFLAVIVGIAITAIIQSSSATTVMVVGFVNAGLMSLVQATGVIMGANIGTTVTSVLVALNLSEIAPLFIFVGAILILFAKKKFVNHIGEITAGFGLLFVGLNTMSNAMSPLKDSAVFTNFLTNNSNPLIGILIGLVFTAIIQSSSASIGILQALAIKGLVPIQFAVFVLYGQNIGTCVTTLLSSVGGKSNSKRAAIIHLLFNVIGTAVFIVISYFTPYISLLKLISNNTVVQISAAHIIFNVLSTVILFPFSKLLVKLACRIVPEDKDKLSEEKALKFLDDRILSTPPLAVSQISLEVLRMAHLAKNNFIIAAKAFINSDNSNLNSINDTEEIINYINHNITPYLVKINNLDISESDSEYIGRVFHAVNDIERISDHATNLAEATEYRVMHNPKLSDEAFNELNEMLDSITVLLNKSLTAFEKQHLDYAEAKEIVELEEHIDDLHDNANENHIIRMKNNLCDTEAGPLFINTITDFERVADHSINIAFFVRNPPKIII